MMVGDLEAGHVATGLDGLGPRQAQVDGGNPVRAWWKKYGVRVL